MPKWTELSANEKQMLIHKKVMELPDIEYTPEMRVSHDMAVDAGDLAWEGQLYQAEQIEPVIIPDYLHDMNAAMTVVKKWPHKVSMWKTMEPDMLPWCCAFYTNDNRYRVLGYDLIMAKAICHAALLAVEAVEE
jgi:hypothetical protein